MKTRVLIRATIKTPYTKGDHPFIKGDPFIKIIKNTLPNNMDYCSSPSLGREGRGKKEKWVISTNMWCKSQGNEWKNPPFAKSTSPKVEHRLRKISLQVKEALKANYSYVKLILRFETLTEEEL